MTIRAATLCLLVAWTAPAVALEPFVILRDYKGKGMIHAVAFAPDGKRAASTELVLTAKPEAGCYVVALWDVTTGRETTLLHDQIVQSLAFSPDGKLLATATAAPSPDGTTPGAGLIVLWDLATGKRVGQLAGHEKPVIGVRYSADGKLLASVDLFGTLKLWDAASRKLLRDLGGDGQRVWSGYDLAFAPDGRTLATAGGQFKGVRLWDTTSGKVRAEIPEEQGANAVAFSSDGKHLAFNQHSASPGQAVSIGLTDATGKSPVRSLSGLHVKSLAFSPDGKKLAAGRSPQAQSDVVLWDIATAKAWQWPRTLDVSYGSVLSMAFAPDGLRLIASRGSQLILWDTRTAQGPNNQPPGE